MNKVQVLMPAYNCEKYIEQAVDSIINQTHRNIELLVINDGSTDNTDSILKQLSKQHKNIRYWTQPHSGTVSTLNSLVSKIDAPYIARMDADDISSIERIAKQLDLMQCQNLDVVGSWVELFGDENKVWHYREHDNLCRIQSLFGRSPLLQGSLLCKREVFDSIPYKQEFLYVEDIDFIFNVISARRFKLGAVREVLLKYRRYDSSVSLSEKLASNRFHSQFYKLLPEHLLKMGIDLSSTELSLFRNVALMKKVEKYLFIDTKNAYKRITLKIRDNISDDFFELNQRWFSFCRLNLAPRELLTHYNEVFPTEKVCLINEFYYRNIPNQSSYKSILRGNDE